MHPPSSAPPSRLGWAILFLALVSLGATAPAASPDGQLSLRWTNNLLTVSSPNLSGGTIEIWYLEAFCRKGSTHREWSKTVLPHKTVLLSAEPDHLRFRTDLDAGVVMRHDVLAGADEVTFRFELKNLANQPVDLEWFQPACIRVEQFTGLDQTNYTSRSFIFTDRGLTPLAKTHRRTDALYRGGQVYVMNGIDLEDINPRPICYDQPVNGLIGCFSADGKQLLATASDRTHELFEGVYVCLHSDPHVGGLAAHETRIIHSKLYLIKNDVVELLRRYRRDFPDSPNQVLDRK